MTKTTDFILYHAPRTRSVRIRWMLEEMGLPYTLEKVQFASRPVGDEAYADIHPLRKVPVFIDGDTKIFESLATMQYVLERYGPSPLAVNPDEGEFGRYLQWLHFGESGMMMPVSLLLAHTVLFPEDQRDPKIAAWAKSETDKLLAFLSSHAIADREFVCADRFTVADISIIYMLFLLNMIRQFDDAPDNVKAYYKSMTTRQNWLIANDLD